MSASWLPNSEAADVVVLIVESALTLSLDSGMDQDELDTETGRGPDPPPHSSVRDPLKPALTLVCSRVLRAPTLFRAFCRGVTLAMKVFFYKQNA